MVDIETVRELAVTARRADPLRLEQGVQKAVDFLAVGAYDENEIWVFGEIIDQLVQELEVAAKVRLSGRIAQMPSGPPQVLSRLALDNSIQVAGPILQNASQLSPETLLACARTKGQGHLLAISRRKAISTEVTDVLVARGDQQVVRSVAANPGARLSETSFFELVRRADNDMILVESLGTRRDIPRRVFQQLIAKASDTVRQKLAREHPHFGQAVESSVAAATGDMHAKFGPASSRFYAARKEITRLQAAGALNESLVLERATQSRFEEVVVCLSLLGGVPVHIVDRVLTSGDVEMICIMTKALGFAWEATRAVLLVVAPDRQMSLQRLDQAQASFANMNPKVCRAIFASHRKGR